MVPSALTHLVTTGTLHMDVEIDYLDETVTLVSNLGAKQITIIINYVIILTFGHQIDQFP